MKYLTALLLLAALAIFAACGDDDDSSNVPSVADICPENPSPAPDTTVVIDSPDPGDEIRSPVRITGSINAFQGNFYVSIVDENGFHITDDFPGHTDQPDAFAPFSVEVPFFITEAVDACVIVSRQTDDLERDEQKLMRVVHLLPDATPEASE